MRKHIFFIILLVFLFFSLATGALALEPSELDSTAAILMDADTGQVLFDKNMTKRAYPASTTKIITGLVVMENADPSELVTVSDNAVKIMAGSSHIALTPGEQLTVDEAMYALMLPSANDAANALAEHVAGDQDTFAQMMTEKAKQIGALNTNFANAHGLHDDNHYTTAYDLALITRYALNVPSFMKYFGTDLYTLAPTNLQSEERYFTNYQYMLVDTTAFYNEDVVAGKVGFTNEAQHTMSTIATKDGRTLVCIVMDAGRNEKFYDTQKLLDYGFDEFSPVTIDKEDVGVLVVPVEENGMTVGEATFNGGADFTALVHNSIDPVVVRTVFNHPDAYDAQDVITATVSYVLDGVESGKGIPSLLGTAPLVADVSITGVPVMAQPQETTKSSFSLVGVLKGTLLVLSGLLTLFILWVAYRRYIIMKRRKARRERFNRRLQQVQQNYYRPR